MAPTGPTPNGDKKMNAPKVMIEAIRTVSTQNRLKAALLAEKVFYAHLKNNKLDGDFTDEECIAMSAEAAASEIYYQFA